MVTAFDLKNRATWPSEGRAVLWLVKSDYEDKVVTCAGVIDTESRIPNIDVTGVGGWDYDNDFTIEDVIAWQPIPNWNPKDPT